MGNKLQKKRNTTDRRKRTSNNNSHSEVAGFDILHSQLPNPMQVDENSCDRISDLPDDILGHIISSLAFELVAQSRLLSTRWRDVWDITLVQKGSIDAMAKELTGFLASVDWVKPLAHPWKLRFHSDEGSCVLEASVGVNNKLHLDFSHGDSNSPTEFDLKLEPSDRHLIPCPFGLRIRSLYLNSVNNLSSRMISSLMLNLNFLESIEIKECKGMVHMSVFAEWKLKNLTIIDCDQLKSISIIGYALESLRYKGRLPTTYIFLGDAKDVMLDCREGLDLCDEGRCDDFRCFSYLSLLLVFLKDAEHITLCQWTFQAMIRPRLYSKDPDAQFNYLKELWWICSSMDDENINSLISFLEVCPKIHKLYVTIDPTCYRLPNPTKADFDWTSKVPSSSKFKRLRCLTVVKMDGVTSEADELQLADRIFQITTKNPKVLATSRNSSYTRRLVKISRNQRKFVEEIDTQLLNTKHMHMSS